MNIPAIGKIAAAALFLATAAQAATPANNCDDPYWKKTLRCVANPGATPQPNLDELPDVAAGQPMPAFDRVFLDQTTIRCTDGTMPLFYVDKAVCTKPAGCGNGIRRGDPVESDRWLFTFQGGESCNEEKCFASYADPSERGSMGSSGKPVVRDLEGIYSPDPVKNPLFAGYNRVRVEKCTFDRYMGRSQDESTDGAVKTTLPDGTEVAANMYYHGWFIVEETMKRLDAGLRYRTWSRDADRGRRRTCCGASGTALSAVEEKLPPLRNAEVVLLIGHSNASHGLYHNADNIAALLASLPGFGADVRALFDANFLPSVENEAAFAHTAQPGKDLYDSIWTGTSTVRGESFSYDGASYHAISRPAMEYTDFAARLDSSCLEAHAADGTTWKCQDRLHVLFNHISTPFMAREDFLDPNVEHLDAPNGHNVPWGNDAKYLFCPDSAPCKPRFNQMEYRERIEKQAQTLLLGRNTRSEMARGIDGSAASMPTFYVWLPKCRQHEGAYTDASFFGATIATEGGASFSMRQWLEDFMSAPRTGVRRYKIDGANDVSGGKMTTSKCE